jgi:hypothetical protein
MRDGEIRRSSPENKLATICQSRTPLRHPRSLGIATPRHLLLEPNAAMIIAPYFCPAAGAPPGHGCPLNIPAAPLQTVSARSSCFFLDSRALSPRVPDRYSSPAANQHPIEDKLVTLSLASESLHPASWEDGRSGQTHGVQQLSYPSIQLPRGCSGSQLSTPHLASLWTG